MLFALVFILSALVSTIILAGTLSILSDHDDNPFARDEHIASWIRCLGLVVLVKLIVLVPLPFTELVAVLLWFAGIMYLFARSFWQVILIIVSNAVLGIVVISVLNALLPTPWLLPLPLVVVASLIGWFTYRRRSSATWPTCPSCGYSLRGHVGRSRCPECGTPIRVPAASDDHAHLA